MDLGVRNYPGSKILVEDLDDRIKNVITVICDVNNPLVGPNGATAVYGRKRGSPMTAFPSLNREWKTIRL